MKPSEVAPKNAFNVSIGGDAGRFGGNKEEEKRQTATPPKKGGK